MNYKECLKIHFRLFLLAVLSAFLIASCGSQSKHRHLERGEDYLQKRKFHEALMEFRSAVEIDKNFGAAYWGMARAHENLGDYSETVENLRRTVELAPDNLDAKAKLGTYFIHFTPPAVGETEKILEEIFAQNPKFIEGYILKATLFDVQKKPEAEVLEVLKQAIALDTERTESYMSLSRYFMKKKNAEKAEKAIQEGINAGRNKTVGHIEYGRFLVYNERVPEAEAQFLKAVETDRNNIEAREAVADFYVGQKEFQKAEQVYLDLVKIQENSPESRLDLAGFYERTGRKDDALRILIEITADSPEYARAHYRLAEIYLEQKEFAKTSEQIEKLLNINDADAQALLLKARLRLAENKPNEAVKDLEEVLKKQPSLRDGLYLMAQTYLALGQADQARAFIGDLERYHPNFLKTKLLKIQASFTAGQTEVARREANELLEKASQPYPSAEISAGELEDLRQRAMTARGLANLELGKVEEAKIDLQEVARRSPNSTAALLNLAKVSIYEKKFDEALTFYEKILNAEAGNFDALSGLIAVLNRQGKFAESNRRIDEAMQKQSGNSGVTAALHYLKAETSLSENNTDAAETHLKNSIAADDTYLPAYTAYASILVRKNQTAAAIEQYQKLLEKTPSASVHTLLGMLYEADGNSAEAEKNYRRALEIAPGTPIAANNLAWLIADTGNGNLDEALKLAQSAVDQNQTSAGFYDTLGWVYFKKGLFSPAVEQFRRAVSLDENQSREVNAKPNPAYRVRLGMALAEAGDKNTAKKEVAAALQNEAEMSQKEVQEAKTLLAGM